jgi:RHS repeat-associated protein
MVLDAGKYLYKVFDNQAITIPAASNQMSQSNGVSSIDPTKIALDAPHNHLNLPAKWDFGGNNSIEFWYDGLGTKLRKIVKANNVVTLTQDYLGRIEIKNNAIVAVYNEEGRAFMNAGAFRYEYVLRDHLGNTRLSFTDKNGNGVINSEAEILQENHYYPFGKSMEGSWYKDAAASKYRYLYNGKELNEEFGLNFYDYGARWLDPGVGSWWQVDPATAGNYSQSPYQYVLNNPVKYIDPFGLWETTATGYSTTDQKDISRYLSYMRLKRKLWVTAPLDRKWAIL